MDLLTSVEAIILIRVVSESSFLIDGAVRIKCFNHLIGCSYTIFIDFSS